jgi:hypothetical protein
VNQRIGAIPVEKEENTSVGLKSKVATTSYTPGITQTLFIKSRSSVTDSVKFSCANCLFTKTYYVNSQLRSSLFEKDPQSIRLNDLAIVADWADYMVVSNKEIRQMEVSDVSSREMKMWRQMDDVNVPCINVINKEDPRTCKISGLTPKLIDYRNPIGCESGVGTYLIKQVD